MDTRAFSMARVMRFTATVGALVIGTAFGPSFAQQHGEDQLLIPFSSLSASAQAEILALQRDIARASAPAAPLPQELPVARQQTSPVGIDSALANDRRVRTNWAIGMYR